MTKKMAEVLISKPVIETLPDPAEAGGVGVRARAVVYFPSLGAGANFQTGGSWGITPKTSKHEIQRASDREMQCLMAALEMIRNPKTGEAFKPSEV